MCDMQHLSTMRRDASSSSCAAARPEPVDAAVSLLPPAAAPAAAVLFENAPEARDALGTRRSLELHGGIDFLRVDRPRGRRLRDVGERVAKKSVENP